MPSDLRNTPGFLTLAGAVAFFLLAQSLEPLAHPPEPTFKPTPALYELRFKAVERRGRHCLILYELWSGEVLTKRCLEVHSA